MQRYKRWLLTSLRQNNLMHFLLVRAASNLLISSLVYEVPDKLGPSLLHYALFDIGSV